MKIPCVLIAFTLFIGCFNNSLHAQFKSGDSERHVYKINYWVSGTIAGVGGITNYLAIPHVIDKQEISIAEFQNLNRNIISGFDKWALNQDPSKINMYNKDADITLIVSVIAPGALAFDKGVRQEWGRILVMYLETISLVSNVYTNSFIGPSFQNKFRPVVYYDALPYDQRNDGNNRNSFYSGHVATVAAATFFMAKVYADYHPEIGGNKYWLYAAASVPPLLLGYFRIMGLRHFPSDVMAGFGIGAAFGILIPEIHRIKFKNKDLSLGLASTGESTGLSLKWQPGSGK